VAAKVRAAEQLLLEEQQRQAAKQARLAELAAHYASKVSDIWCAIHHRRVFVTSIDTSGSEPRFEVAGCCQEALHELFRWLEIYRPRLSAES
jgi:hypothetical protein